MMSNTLSVDNLEVMIADLEDRAAKLKELLEKIKPIKMFEVGIRKSDNAVCHFEFELDFGHKASVMVTVLPPKTSATRITLEEWIENYVEYSPKARSILPKRG
jgi:hypothetical protein